MNPELEVEDPICALWLAQVTLRLRREIAWCWHQRGTGAPPTSGALPPFGDSVQESLDLSRFHTEKREFFESDVAARYLSERIATLDVPRLCLSRRGDWTWIARECGLTAAAQFVMACALANRTDAALGAVWAACHNDAVRPWPTLALAQRLWDDPASIVACADANHLLFRRGLLLPPAGRDALEWQQPLEMPASVARALLEGSNSPAGMIAANDADAVELPIDMLPSLARLRSDPPNGLQVVPLHATRGTDFVRWSTALARACGRGLMVIPDDMTAERPALVALANTCWLIGLDVLLPEQWLERSSAGAPDSWISSVAALPLRWHLPVIDSGSALRSVPPALLLPAITLPALDAAARARRLAAALVDASPAMRAAIPEVSRRFRLSERPLDRVAAAACALEGDPGANELFAVCRAEARLELDGLANAVVPRFELGDLVLPTAQAQQLQEIVSAMRVLGRVHYEWGTARVWNEAGLSVLFCGSSGTGKTMAAEALAHALELPMYRIDLSQVVNKYIGETEKNLRRIFDAAEKSDCLMFFDEADALFGKRTEVRDAHDRFANIEISYLLERMERFKGLAVLASNRRKDLDEAFTRRLRYIVEFPMPGAAERERLWRQAFPPRVDVAGLDCRWLAQQFELAGGHIRSAAFNACLSAAGQSDGAAARVDMLHVLTAVKRELEKLSRVAGREQFGQYAPLIGGLG
jgi:hypothetical protein